MHHAFRPALGRLGPWDLGFLNIRTAPLHEENLPSENFGVFRARRRVFNPYSYVGGIITTRLGTDGSYNTVYGVDGTFRVQGDDYLLLNWAQSFETGKDNNVASLDPARFRIGWERRTRKGLVFNEGLNTNRGRDIPYRPYYSGRAVMIKYSYTFVF